MKLNLFVIESISESCYVIALIKPLFYFLMRFALATVSCLL